MTETVQDLQRRIAEVQAAEAEAVQEAARQTEQRDLAYRRQRLAAYEPHEYRRAIRDADSAFVTALAEAPVFAAYAAAQVARWAEFQAAQTAHNDRVALALAAGTEPPHDPGNTVPPPLGADAFTAALNSLVSQGVEESHLAVDEAHAEAVLGTLDPQLLAAAGEAAESERRRQAALSISAGSTDVTGMSEAERADLGLPPGRPERD